MARDYYQTLGIARSADATEIKRAYRALAREHHPDVTGDDPRSTERFKEITEAYEVLSDPTRRRQYDMFGTRDKPPPGGGPFPPLDLDSLLDQVFPKRKKKPRPEPGVDVERPLQVSFADAWKGATHTIEERREKLTVQVPAGVETGTRLRLRGKGSKGIHGADNGDLYVRLDVQDDPRFQRAGQALHATARVPLRACLLGGEVEVPLPVGSARMKIPAGTQGGQVFRLKGQGFPRPGGSQRGDAYVAVAVDIPAVRDPEKLLAALEGGAQADASAAGSPAGRPTPGGGTR